MTEKGIRKIQNDNLHLQFSKKKKNNNTEAHVIRKDSSSPPPPVPEDRDRTDTNVIAPLTMHF